MSAVIIPFPRSRHVPRPAANPSKASPAREEGPLTPGEIAAIRKIFLDCPIARRAREAIDRDS